MDIRVIMDILKKDNWCWNENDIFSNKYNDYTFCIKSCSNDLIKIYIKYYNEVIFKCVKPANHIYFSLYDDLVSVVNKRDKLFRVLEDNNFKLHINHNSLQFIKHVLGDEISQITITINKNLKKHTSIVSHLDNIYITMKFHNEVYFKYTHCFFISYDELINMDFNNSFNRYIERDVLLNGL